MLQLTRHVGAEIAIEQEEQSQGGQHGAQDPAATLKGDEDADKAEDKVGRGNIAHPLLHCLIGKDEIGNGADREPDEDEIHPGDAPSGRFLCGRIEQEDQNRREEKVHAQEYEEGDDGNGRVKVEEGEDRGNDREDSGCLAGELALARHIRPHHPSEGSFGQGGLVRSGHGIRSLTSSIIS